MLIQIVLTFIASETNFTHLTFGCEGSVTAFRLLCCVVICLLRLALFANVYPHFLQSNGVSVSNSDCWSSLTIDLICSVTNSCSASSLTFRRKSRRIVSTCFLSSSALQRVRKSWLNLPSWWVITACFTNWFGYFMECNLEYDFHDLKKMQNMLRCSGQNANQKVGTDKMPTTEKSQDKMPTFGWHYVRLAFCPVGILSYHLLIVV